VRVCANPECEQGGTPQPLENFHNGKYRCKRCTRKYHQITNARWKERVQNSNVAVERERNTELPIGPWREWIEGQIQIHGLQQVCFLIGVADRVVHRWRYENKSVRLDAVDRALCNYRRPELLRALYPDLYRTCRVCSRVGVHSKSCPLYATRYRSKVAA
jgi:hypothetical protein